MTVQEFMEMTDSMLIHDAIRPHAICTDGYALSIQGGAGLYCCAKVDVEPGEYMGIDFSMALSGEIKKPHGHPQWQSVEVALFPHQELMMEDECEFLSDGCGYESMPDDSMRVFPYTSVERLDELISWHGGIAYPDPDINSVFRGIKRKE